MKHILFACFLLTAICSVPFIQPAAAQGTTTVTQAAFTTQINLLDSYIAAGNMTAAQSTWTNVHNMMKSVFATLKQDIMGATNPTDKATYTAINQNEWEAYRQAMNLKEHMAANRAALHTQLVTFASNIH